MKLPEFENWQERCPPELRSRIAGVQAGLEMVHNNHVVVTAMAAAEPRALFTHLHQRLAELSGVVVYCANPAETYPCFADPDLRERVSFNVMFLNHALRQSPGRSLFHYTPQHLSRWGASLLRRHEVDVFWGTCSPPDDRGFVNLGVGACYETEVIRSARRVILEVNPFVPVTRGATPIPASRVDLFIDNPMPLVTLPDVEVNDVDRQIGERVASLVPDGATIQLGIGSIPNALSDSLADKKDLGVHTELINDAIFRLYQRGAVTGAKKTIWPERIVGAFALGSSELYDFVHRNPAVEFHPASVVNDPYRIGRNHQMISINSAVEIDVTGQVCSESIGHREISGVGGACDTHTGAQRSPGGRGILAMHSKTSRGQSKIVFELKPGAKVSISRNDVDTVITEYGIAELSGRSTRERAMALIAIAAPEFRDELLEQAIGVGYM